MVRTYLPNVHASLGDHTLLSAQRADESVDGEVYIGISEPGTQDNEPKWQIYKIVVADGITTKTWADGNAEPDNIWDNRKTSITYR